jgi:predicted RNA-binding protein
MAKAYRREGDAGQCELLLEDLARIEVEGETIRLSSIFGDTTEVKGTIREIDFQSGSVIVEGAA